MKIFSFKKSKEKFTVYDNGSIKYGKEIYQFDEIGVNNFDERVEQLDIFSLPDAYENGRAKLTFYKNGLPVKKVLYGLSCQDRLLHNFVFDIMELINEMNLFDL